VSNLAELNLPGRIRTILVAHGIGEMEELVELTPRELGGFRGIGPRSVVVIQKALAEVGQELAFDPLGPYECARHGREAWDAGLRSFFLCDVCASEFKNAAFSGADPEYVGPSMAGHCSHCNKPCETIRIRQWFLCGVCDRVVRSIGRSIAADTYLLSWWEEKAAVRLPTLELTLTDPPELRPYSYARIETKVARVDFTCADTASGVDIFGLELKTGRSYIQGTGVGSKMQQFQLDHSDCDDIVSVVRTRGFPVYVVHAQVIDRADPPTTYFVAVGLWWTDMFSMKPHHKASRTRPRETRIAAYYDTSMFREMGSFIEHLESGGAAQLTEGLHADGVPELY